MLIVNNIGLRTLKYKENRSSVEFSPQTNKNLTQEHKNIFGGDEYVE